MKATQTLTSLAGAAALLFVLTASKCENTTEFPAYKQEICSDNLDNDSDGRIDCADSDCNNECAVQISIDAVPATLAEDTLRISGSVSNSASVAVSVQPSGNASAPIVTGNVWEAKLTDLLAKTRYTITATASDSNKRKASDTAAFERR